MDFSAVHLHLILNHSPLFAQIFAFCLLLFGLIRRRREFVTAALVVTIIAAVCGFLADQTGGRAADFLTKANPPIAGVDTSLIRDHGLAAEWVVITSGICAAVAIVALFMGRRGARPRWIEIVLAILLLHALTVTARTALLGGRIHHQEVREAPNVR